MAKGFRIAARRWRSPAGEIDIVARRGNLLVFVEVKARARLDDAAFAVTERQTAHRAAAEAWLAAIPTMPCATCVSTPCWSRRGACRGTSRRRSRRSEFRASSRKRYPLA